MNQIQNETSVKDIQDHLEEEESFLSSDDEKEMLALNHSISTTSFNSFANTTNDMNSFSNLDLKKQQEEMDLMENMIQQEIIIDEVDRTCMECNISEQLPGCSWIGCHVCEQWAHNACVGKPGHIQVLDYFACKKCSVKQINLDEQNLRQGSSFPLPSSSKRPRTNSGSTEIDANAPVSSYNWFTSLLLL